MAIGQVELAWLTGADPAAEAVQRVLARADRPGSGRWRGELLRYLQRAGATAAPFDGCPPEYATGLRGDWAGAAGEWARIGDPYQRALELAESDPRSPRSRRWVCWRIWAPRRPLGWCERGSASWA